MSKRTYGQYCAVAAALDVLGERWTLLIVLNLLYGPKRFKDLYAALPGIGTGLLTERLNQLQADQVIERASLPPPTSTPVYQLTADGRALHGLLIELARWGTGRLGPIDGRAPVSPDVLVLALEASFDPDAAGGADNVYQLRIDNVPYRIEIQNQRLSARLGVAEHPAATVTVDINTLAALNAGDVTPQAALATDRLTLAGDPTSAAKLTAAFGFQLDASTG